MPAANVPAGLSMTLTLGGGPTVCRLGFGAMRATGPGVWGPPRDEARAVALLRRVVDQGVNFIDTADSYGPGVSESLIAKALYPYPAGLVIATKGGLLRPGPDRWTTDCRPEHLRQACTDSLRRLRLDRIELYQLLRSIAGCRSRNPSGSSSIFKPRVRSAISGCRTCRPPNWPARSG
jgi:pyridoxine 4-dehydrogenase